MNSLICSMSTNNYEDEAEASWGSDRAEAGVETRAETKPKVEFMSLEWIEDQSAQSAQCGWLGNSYGELEPNIIRSLQGKGYKVERIIHNDRDSEKCCCDACYRTGIIRVSWSRPTAPHFHEAQSGYCDGVHSEISRILGLMDAAAPMDAAALMDAAAAAPMHSIVVEGLYWDRHWMSDETMSFLVGLGCTCDYIDDFDSDDDRSYRISWQETRQPWTGAHDSIHAEIKQLIQLIDQAVKDGKSELYHHVEHAETMTFLKEADVHYVDGLLTWHN
jgi:hypothetical protein